MPGVLPPFRVMKPDYFANSRDCWEELAQKHLERFGGAGEAADLVEDLATIVASEYGVVLVALNSEGDVAGYVAASILPASMLIIEQWAENEAMADGRELSEAFIEALRVIALLHQAKEIALPVRHFHSGRVPRRKHLMLERLGFDPEQMMYRMEVTNG